MKTLFPIRRQKNGVTYLRDGLAFILYLKGEHAHIVAQVADFLQTYLTFIGRETLTWIHDKGEYFVPLTATKWNRVWKLLSTDAAQQRKKELFTLKDGDKPDEASGHLFQYRGVDTNPVAPQQRSYIEIWFPSDWPDNIGYERFVTELLKLADCVPVISGSCSLAFNFTNWGAVDAEACLQNFAFRHPGLDIHLSRSTHIFIGDRARGAFWLTLLGNGLLQKLRLTNGKMRQELDSAIQIHQKEAFIAIQAGPIPLTGDTNHDEHLPLVRQVAKLIEPVTFIQETGIFGFSEVEKFIAWQRRHLISNQ